ncbi:hypothetical protein NQ314_008531 [Rhamnusium bicolor]|uniref:Uncharacterized protein n=1 Tax=Rhamnusium bicolor TaxID=1586634 RepID=A0AAV8Y8M6_9CUCU|nr:hypothetical protein NQ314_008531 [Rhamnusium bicolor]
MNMDFNMKKIVKDAGAALSRVVQLTEEKLGVEMVEAGNSFGPGTAYGSSLIKVGQWEQEIRPNRGEILLDLLECVLLSLFRSF